MLLFFLLI
jgi:proline- and glutamine-rich splicing factor